MEEQKKTMPADIHCENCKWRAKYESKPASFLGRLWKWHTGWCPGWKKYQEYLASQK